MNGTEAKARSARREIREGTGSVAVHPVPSSPEDASAPERPHLLVVDDEPLLREFLEEALRRCGHSVQLASSGDEALRRVSLDPPDVILLDIRLPGRDGITLLPEFRLLCPEAPVIMMTGHGTLESAVSAMRLGAFDYLTKPFSAEAVELAVDRAFSVGALRRENAVLRGRLSLQEAFATMIGRSRAMEELRTAIRMIAPSRSTVLILGESGTGKELVARSIHEGSARINAPLVKLNCAAVPAGLLESELFGHERGAFTGAVGQRRGKFEQAHGGTLLLDEISEMDIGLQPKLLRALQEREFYRVGGGTPVRVDVRVVATTNTDLRERVRDGNFREDLYYRLEVVPVRVPPLRERREDILVLAHHFLTRFAAENDRRNLRLGPRAGERLLRHTWPGNVRELKNAVERAVILCPGEEVAPEHFVLELSPPARGAGHGGLEPVGGPCAGLGGDTGLLNGASLGDTLHERERAWILDVLEREGGNRTAAARRLGVSVRTIRNKLALYGREDGRRIERMVAEVPPPIAG
jgi:DNA-binding NtrC family response regulator